MRWRLFAALGASCFFFLCFHPMRGWPGRTHKRKRMHSWSPILKNGRMKMKRGATNHSFNMFVALVRTLVINSDFIMILYSVSTERIAWNNMSTVTGLCIEIGPGEMFKSGLLAVVLFLCSPGPLRFFFPGSFLWITLLALFCGSSSTPVFQF